MAKSSDVAVVLGMRPEIIKFGPMIELLGDRGDVVITGQHLDHRMLKPFLNQFSICHSGPPLLDEAPSRGARLGRLFALLDERWRRRRPSVVVVQGDTTSALAGGLAANALDLPLFHVEAGLRSYDRRMPEEHHRVLLDQLADLCCAATTANAGNLSGEGVAAERVAVTGNPVVEAVRRALLPLDARAEVLTRYGLRARDYVFATLHQPEDADDVDTLGSLLEGLGRLPTDVLLPVHPRTRARIEEFGLAASLEPLRVVDPVDHADTLALLAEAALVVTDSGGIQEEVTGVGTPAIVTRRSTERPEALGTLTELLVPGPGLVGELMSAWRRRVDWRSGLGELPSPFGAGTASRRIVGLLRRWVG